MSRKPKVYLVNPDIIDRFSKGQNCQRIADIYGVSKTTISRAIKSVGIRVTVDRPYTTAEEKLILRLWLERWTHQEIADLTARSKASISCKLYRMNKVTDPERFMRRRGVNYSEAA